MVCSRAGEHHAQWPPYLPWAGAPGCHGLKQQAAAAPPDSAKPAQRRGPMMRGRKSKSKCSSLSKRLQGSQGSTYNHVTRMSVHAGRRHDRGNQTDRQTEKQELMEKDRRRHSQWLFANRAVPYQEIIKVSEYFYREAREKLYGPYEPYGPCEPFKPYAPSAGHAFKRGRESFIRKDHVRSERLLAP